MSIIEDLQNSRHWTVCLVFLATGHIGPSGGPLSALVLLMPWSGFLCFFIDKGLVVLIHSGQIVSLFFI